ncbi:uncharacterized protein LOC110039216 [Phalaenopsis equestris]|uniref:uncharacterized protein LOC110039216 n=1 Tax=Phalaenopsis equestris TaxID=78828 RepID=UPI0009E44BC3|nr:uncharacterized protein LOC110039216 [Phalaenopsis equestris]
MDEIRKYFDDLKLVSAWKVGLMDGRHIMIQLAKEEDYARLFAKQVLFLDGISMKLLKWTIDFDPSKEPKIVIIWFKLPRLKLHFFNHQVFFTHQVLFTTGTALGRQKKLDALTFNLSRPSVSRILVERDITQPEIDDIWLSTANNGYWQKIVMEQRPYYCHNCKRFGHTNNRCFRLHPKKKNSVSGHTPIPTQQFTSLHLNPESPTKTLAQNLDNDPKPPLNSPTLDIVDCPPMVEIQSEAPLEGTPEKFAFPSFPFPAQCSQSSS